MVGCLSSGDVKEEVPLLSDVLEPLKELHNSPDQVQLQNPEEFSNIKLDTHLSKSEDESEQKFQTLGSSIDLKMEKVSVHEILDHGEEGEVGLKENELKTDRELMDTEALFEPLKNDGMIVEGICDGVSDMGETSISVNAGFDSRASSSNESCSDKSSSDESSSSVMSSTSSEDEDDCGVKREEAEELEEGQLDDFGDEEEVGPRVPIKSKHEVENLPPVPKIEVVLQSHHQMLPVGVISSIVNNKVIVEGCIRHNPLDEGSILWITHNRLPLGLVDEIFGPVKNPYYIVRYNSEDEVPVGIEVGIAISFVLEFASQILNDKELYQKGYDASGDNDEEVDDDVLFSDDEKEAEFKKSLRTAKRDADDVKGKKQESKFEKKRIGFQASRSRNKGMKAQQTHAPSSNLQPRAHLLPQPAPPVGQPGLVAARSASEYLQRPQPSTFFSNPSQQLVTQQASASWPPPAFPCTLQNTGGLQGGLPLQLQNQNLLVNNLVNLLALQQQFQQFIPNPGNSFPWLGAAPPLQPMAPTALAPNPFANVGLMNMPGTTDVRNEQIQSPVTQPFAPTQFNAGNFNGLSFNAGTYGSRGPRPYQRGGSRPFFQGGRGPNR